MSVSHAVTWMVPIWRLIAASMAIIVLALLDVGDPAQWPASQREAEAREAPALGGAVDHHVGGLIQNEGQALLGDAGVGGPFAPREPVARRDLDVAEDGARQGGARLGERVERGGEQVVE